MNREGHDQTAYIASDKRGININMFLFLHKNILWVLIKHLGDPILTSTHNICWETYFISIIL